MASRFYGEIQGSRGDASRMGTAASGFWGHVRGWGIGARVDMDVSAGDMDTCHVRVTGGSGSYESVSLGYTIRDDKGRLIFYPSWELCAGLGIKYHVHNQGAGHPFRRAILKG